MPVLIAAAYRTPFTRVDGALAGWHPVDLAATVMNHALLKAEIDAGSLDEVWVGCAEPVGAQGADMARAAALAAGWPDHVSGTVIDRAETSGAAALHAAAASIRSRASRVVMVVGVCSASVVAPGASALARAYGRPWGDGPARRMEDAGGLLPPPAAADRAAFEAGISRIAQETWTTGSQQRRSLVNPGCIVSMRAEPGDRVPIQRGAPVTSDDRRERPPDPSMLPSSFDSDGAVTGFTFAPPVDGVTAILLVSGDRESGPAILGCGRAAGHPLDPLGGIERALAHALDDAGCGADDIGRWEITEPTAAATLLAIRRLGITDGNVNPGGGTLAVGDAAAAEELRLVSDTISSATPGALVAALAFGPSGSAATIIRCP